MALEGHQDGLVVGDREGRLGRYLHLDGLCDLPRGAIEARILEALHQETRERGADADSDDAHRRDGTGELR